MTNIKFERANACYAKLSKVKHFKKSQSSKRKRLKKKKSKSNFSKSHFLKKSQNQKKI